MSVIAPGLLVGSVHDAFNTNILSKFHIATILNVASELQFAGRCNMHYYKIGINDDCITSDMQNILPDCLQLIQETMQQGASILVHCLEGKSRSICVVLAYMVIINLQDWDASLSYLKQIRPTIEIFPLYLQQTKSYCESVKQSWKNPPNPAGKGNLTSNNTL